MKRKVLVLEDEENIRSFVVLNLKRAGFEVIEAGSGEQALELFEQHPDIQVAVLDVMLPGIDGYEVCRTMRARGSRAGIIMLTARTQESDKVTGLMTGADDYVTKPFSVVELVARAAQSRFPGGRQHPFGPVPSQCPVARGDQEWGQDRADSDRIRHFEGVYEQCRPRAVA